MTHPSDASLPGLRDESRRMRVLLFSLEIKVFFFGIFVMGAGLYGAIHVHGSVAACKATKHSAALSWWECSLPHEWHSVSSFMLGLGAGAMGIAVIKTRQTVRQLI